MFNQKSEFEKCKEVLRGIRQDLMDSATEFTAAGNRAREEDCQALTFFLSLADKIDD